VPDRYAGADRADQSGRVGRDGELADTLVDCGDLRHRGHRLHPLPRCEPGGNHLQLDVVHLRRPYLRQQLHARRRSVRYSVGPTSTRSRRREHSVVDRLGNLDRRRLRQQLDEHEQRHATTCGSSNRIRRRARI
jgi:hypothetical protein